jgi:hypothetical protein
MFTFCMTYMFIDHHILPKQSVVISQESISLVDTSLFEFVKLGISEVRLFFFELMIIFNLDLCLSVLESIFTLMFVS